MAVGTPEDIVEQARPVGQSPKGGGRSYTGKFLKPVLERDKALRLKRPKVRAAE